MFFDDVLLDKIRLAVKNSFRGAKSLADGKIHFRTNNNNNKNTFFIQVEGKMTWLRGFPEAWWKLHLSIQMPPGKDKGQTVKPEPLPVGIFVGTNCLQMYISTT